MIKKDAKKQPHPTNLKNEILELQQRLVESLEREKRALADYQNLVKRNQEERVRFLQLANQGLIETLLNPLEHLSMAAKQIDDQGLNLVMRDFWQVLEEVGLEEIYPKGEKFNLETMEVVDKEGDGQTVAKVVKRGYRFNGLIIQHAKVIVK
ncbi:nucleotide exchange factor GrpE [Patescibacteria group bacterium]|nr:nucleotide exchange factor GrpE [Patescibacteria group bacterium]MBU1967232.1 nucleotide exchange factor GrpE [Patescibacteria group bacterium]MBU2543073.1 nucleotide exchange factor GrpE [Patescibacteria group bacterium]